MPQSADEQKAIKRAYQQQYYAKNKDTINSKRYQKVECSICYGYYTLAHKAQHNQTSRHTRAVRLRAGEIAPAPQSPENV